jgi:hypothetical protein
MLLLPKCHVVLLSPYKIWGVQHHSSLSPTVVTCWHLHLGWHPSFLTFIFPHPKNTVIPHEHCLYPNSYLWVCLLGTKQNQCHLTLSLALSYKEWLFFLNYLPKKIVSSIGEWHLISLLLACELFVIAMRWVQKSKVFLNVYDNFPWLVYPSVCLEGLPCGQIWTGSRGRNSYVNLWDISFFLVICSKHSHVSDMDGSGMLWKSPLPQIISKLSL